MGSDFIFVIANLFMSSLPYLPGYLVLGLPGLYFSIRHSEDLVDNKNPNLVSLTYMLWPLFLGCVILENAWSLTKKVANFGRKLTLFGVKIFENMLIGIASSAEKTKRNKLVGDYRTAYLDLIEDYSEYTDLE